MPLRHVIALAVALGLGGGLAATEASAALPAPPEGARPAATPLLYQPGGESLLEEVRWVNRCHRVRDHRYRSGWRQVCRRVWVEPPRHNRRGPPPRHPGPPPPQHWR
ncbi:hypothetical protein LPC08_14685 [Roseomonas sp. OT10]|uniref:hypothetical protein n=1 Tax=Roseomonas cutis TaxID=2897332 RepID=UPI001E5D7858|nr:hypothetical protein [Roseomonas sp. OT10]UFN47273.1 hypothetical protein LPC08_14685 [Roseomonas sp. OT10]